MSTKSNLHNSLTDERTSHSHSKKSKNSFSMLTRQLKCKNKYKMPLFTLFETYLSRLLFRLPFHQSGCHFHLSLSRCIFLAGWWRRGKVKKVGKFLAFRQFKRKICLERNTHFLNDNRFGKWFCHFAGTAFTNNFEQHGIQERTIMDRIIFLGKQGLAKHSKGVHIILTIW